MARSHMAAMLVGLSTTVAGCGGSEPKRSAAAAGQELTAVMCPVASVTDKRGVERYEPAKNAFDTATLVGRTLTQAEAEASRHGCVIEVAKQDGRGLPVSIDFAPTRIYVFVERGAVTQIESVGGGI